VPEIVEIALLKPLKSILRAYWTTLRMYLPQNISLNLGYRRWHRRVVWMVSSIRTAKGFRGFSAIASNICRFTKSTM